MAVISCRELPFGRQGVVFDSSSLDRTYLRRFRVRVNSQLDSVRTVCLAADIPRPYAPYITEHESDLGSLCVRVGAQQEHQDDWQTWIVDCNYSSVISEEKGGPQENFEGDKDSPENEPPEIEWDWEIEQRALPKDLDNKPIVNSAGQPFTPAMTFEIGHSILTYTRNEISFDTQRANKYCFVTNKDTFLGAPPGCVLCYPPKAKKVYKGNINYARVTWKFRFGKIDDKGNYETVQPIVLDQGLCQLVDVKEKQAIAVVAGGALAAALGNPAGGMFQVPIQEPVPILSRGGIPITQPVMLDGKGRKSVGRWVKVKVPLPIGPGGALIMVDQQLKFTPEPVWLKFRTLRAEKLSKIMTVIP